MENNDQTKTIIQSKTIHFNWISAIAIPAVWPWIPASFRNQDYAIPALTAYFTIGNIVLRLLSKDKIQLPFTKEE
jgi:hypothetical protein